MRDAFCLSDGWLGLATDFVIFSLLALSAWLVLRTGRISLGQQAFFGLGAYAADLGTVGAGWSLGPALALGAVVGGLAALGMSALLARLSGLHYAVATLAFAELVRLGLMAWRWRWPGEGGQMVGPDGVDGFREIRWLQLNRVSSEDYLWLAAGLLLGALALWTLLSRTRWALGLRACGHDDTLARASGLPVDALRVAAGGLAGMLAGLSGGLFAHRLTFLDPLAFDPMLGIHAVGYALLGGLATAAGPLLGTAFDLGLLQATAELAAWRMVVFGGLVALFLRWRPCGLLDEAMLDRAGQLLRSLRSPNRFSISKGHT